MGYDFGLFNGEGINVRQRVFFFLIFFFFFGTNEGSL